MPKVDELDFKTGEPVAPDGPTEETVVETPEAAPKPKVEEPQEDVEALKERLKKSEEEKENYKKGLLSAKKTLKTLEPEKEEEEEYPEWDETSKKFQKQTLSEATKAAKTEAKEIVEKYNEKAAISSFIKDHPELEDDSKWQDIVSNYNPKHGKESIDDVKKDLERAYLLTRYEKGELNQKDNKAAAQVADKQAVSKITSKSVKDDGKTLSESALRLAQAMRVDPKKLAEEDDSLTAEIKL